MTDNNLEVAELLVAVLDAYPEIPVDAVVDAGAELADATDEVAVAVLARLAEAHGFSSPRPAAEAAEVADRVVERLEPAIAAIERELEPIFARELERTALESARETMRRVRADAAAEEQR